MAKVLFFNSPLYGHATPTFALVRELVTRGEEVTYYLTEEFAPSIRAAGAIFEGYTSTIKGNRPGGRFSRLLVEECQHVIPQILERVRHEQPDYIIYEASCLWGRIVAQSFAVPVISCRASLAVNQHFSHISHLLNGQSGTGSGDPFRLLIETLNDLAPLADLCARYNLPTPKQDVEALFFHAEELNIVFIPRLLQPAGETFDKRFLFIGPSLGSRVEFSDVQTEVTADSSRPLLYISLGTIYNAQPEFYKLCFQAFGGGPWQVLTALGTTLQPTELEPPENFQLRPSVPQLEVLQRTGVFITHGGLNSITEALYYGVPMVIIPQMPEQAITAQLLAQQGLAIVLDKHSLTATALRDAVERLTHDPSLSERLQRVKQEVQSSGGVQYAADTILTFASSKHPIARH